MTKDEIIDCFRSAPMGSRHERMLWAAEKIARLTGTTEGESYQKLLIALIEAEKQLDPWNSMSAHELRHESTNIDCLRKVCWIGVGFQNSCWFLPPLPPAEKANAR